MKFVKVTRLDVQTHAPIRDEIINVDMISNFYMANGCYFIGGLGAIFATDEKSAQRIMEAMGVYL